MLDMLQDISSNSIQFTKVSGNLIDSFIITDLQYHDDALALSSHNFLFNWEPKDIFSGKITINQIDASGLNITQLTPDIKNDKNSQSSSPLSQLPEIKLPFEVFLKQIKLSDINYSLAPNTQPQHIESIYLKADFINSRLSIHQLSISAPLPLEPDSSVENLSLENQNFEDIAQVQIQGHADLLNDYPLTLQSNITLDLANLMASLHQPKTPHNESKLFLKGEVAGSLSQLDITQKITGFLEVSMLTQINHLLGDMKWNTELHILKLPVKLLTAQNQSDFSKAILTAQLTASGDLNQATTEIQAHLLEMSPIDSLQVNTTLNWQDAIKWQANIQTKKINPGIVHQDWSGSLDLDLRSDGQLSEDQLSINIYLDRLNGHLREKTVDGGGAFHINNNTVSIDQLFLSSGDAKFNANGKLDNFGEKVNLNWFLDIKQLSDLLPDAQGSVIGQGNIDGVLNHNKGQYPIANAQLKLANIDYQLNHLNHADIQVSLNIDPTQPSNIELSAKSLVIDSQEIKHLELDLKGPLKKHQLKIMAQHDFANLALGANGQFDIESLNWTGQIKQFDFDGPELGQWQQQTPAEFIAGKDKISLSPLCLVDISPDKNSQDISKKTAATLCTQLDWAIIEKNFEKQSKTQAKGQASIQLKQLSFERIKAHIPEEITNLTGKMNIKAYVDLGPQLLANIKADIEPGELSFQSLSQQTIKLPHRNGLLTANYNKQQLDAQWNIEVGPHSIDGQIKIPRKDIEINPTIAPIKGNIDIDIKDLNLLTLIVPQVSDASGYLLAKLTLDGQLNSPRLSGHANFVADDLSLHDAGIRITKTNISLQDKQNGQALMLLGKLHSGDGQLDLNGLITLDADQGWPISLELKGENFLAMNTPDIYAVISPDIQFHQEKSLMHLKGNILLPEATFSPSTIPEGSVSVSSDVEVLGTEKVPPANIDLNINLALGSPDQSKKVKLDAFGLKTNLSGNLTINQRPQQLMTAHGELNLKDGTYRAYGQDLTIDKGSIFYAGGYIDNPGIKLTASRYISDTTVGIKVSGSARKPKVNTFSDDPNLATKDIIAMMLTGQKVNNMENAKIYAGTEISEGLSVGVNAGMGDEGSEFVTRYKLTDKIQLEGTSSATKSGGSVIYTFEVE
ncbi:MAG: translocation/assembly module TamB domain-containing protein [Gammaproteobacteria bacterium]|nr:translocation/assembly module TamB domain-containing protein [Gammaproteobacteria bacterium]